MDASRGLVWVSVRFGFYYLYLVLGSGFFRRWFWLDFVCLFGFLFFFGVGFVLSLV